MVREVCFALLGLQTFLLRWDPEVGVYSVPANVAVPTFSPHLLVDSLTAIAALATDARALRDVCVTARSGAGGGRLSVIDEAFFGAVDSFNADLTGRVHELELRSQDGEATAGGIGAERLTLVTLMAELDPVRDAVAFLFALAEEAGYLGPTTVVTRGNASLARSLAAYKASAAMARGDGRLGRSSLQLVGTPAARCALLVDLIVTRLGHDLAGRAVSVRCWCRFFFFLLFLLFSGCLLFFPPCLFSCAAWSIAWSWCWTAGLCVRGGGGMVWVRNAGDFHHQHGVALPFPAMPTFSRPLISYSRCL